MLAGILVKISLKAYINKFSEMVMNVVFGAKLFLLSTVSLHYRLDFNVKIDV